MKILIVEDQQSMGETIQRRLGVLRDRFPESDIVLVGTWKEGSRVVGEVPHPDVSFLDLTLPDSDWENTLANIDHFEDKSPVIIITGHPEDSVRALLLHRPEIEIIPKNPDMWGKLLGAIARAIQRSNSGNMGKIESNLQKLKEMLAHAPTTQ